MNLIKDPNTNAILWYGALPVYVANGVYRTPEYNLGIPEASGVVVNNVKPLEHYIIGAYSYGDNGWVMTDEEIYNEGMKEVKAKVAKEVRAKRNALLQESDWTQIPDVMLANKTTWVEYRKALRDISAQPGFPLEITWPATPTVPASNQPASSGTQEV